MEYFLFELLLVCTDHEGPEAEPHWEELLPHFSKASNCSNKPNFEHWQVFHFYSIILLQPQNINYTKVKSIWNWPWLDIMEVRSYQAPIIMHIHDMLLRTGRGGLGTWCSFCGLGLLGCSFVFLDVGPSILFLVLQLFLGCFDLFMTGRVSSHTYSLTSLQGDKKLQTTTQLSQGTQLTGHGEPAHHEGCIHPKP
jgi:hypothetical protein